MQWFSSGGSRVSPLLGAIVCLILIAVTASCLTASTTDLTFTVGRHVWQFDSASRLATNNCT
jgi:hypothetical protein